MRNWSRDGEFLLDISEWYWIGTRPSRRWSTWSVSSSWRSDRNEMISIERSGDRRMAHYPDEWPRLWIGCLRDLVEWRPDRHAETVRWSIPDWRSFPFLERRSPRCRCQCDASVPIVAVRSSNGAAMGWRGTWSHGFETVHRSIQFLSDQTWHPGHREIWSNNQWLSSESVIFALPSEIF